MFRRRPAARSLTVSLAPVVLGCTAVLLSACGSSPMPKMPPLVPSRPAQAAAPASAPVASPAASAPKTATPAPVQVSPLEAPAVAARFPDPATAFTLASLQDDRTDFTTTAELDAKLRALAATQPAAPSENPTSIALVSLGNSQDTTPLQALVFTRHPTPSAAVIVRGGRPTVLLVGQQHGDEPAGAEALLVVADELATGSLQGLLDRINVVILPRANPDGAGRNQASTTIGTDLDTDHLLLTTPEAKAVAKLARDYRPLVVVDAHEYPVDPAYATRFGGAQRADVQLQYAATARLPEFITKASEEWFRQPVLTALRDGGYTSEWAHRPGEGQRLAMGSPRPDSARNVNGLRNAISFVVESRGGNLGRVHLKRRVASQVAVISDILRSSAQRADDLVKLRKYVDASVRADLCNSQMLIDPRPSVTEHTLVLLDPATGADKSVAVNWDSSLVLRDGKQRSRPCGYWLAADQTDAVGRLRALGLRVEQLSEAFGMQADANAGTPVAGEREFIEFAAPAGSYYVPLSQPWGNLVVAALEADAAQGFLAAKVVTAPNKLRKVAVVPKVRRTLLP